MPSLISLIFKINLFSLFCRNANIFEGKGISAKKYYRKPLEIRGGLSCSAFRREPWRIDG